MVGWKSVTRSGSRESAKLPAEENTISLANDSQCFPFAYWSRRNSYTIALFILMSV